MKKLVIKDYIFPLLEWQYLKLNLSPLHCTHKSLVIVVIHALNTFLPLTQPVSKMETDFLYPVKHSAFKKENNSLPTKTKMTTFFYL